jgi:hypothetical protein
MSGTRYREKLGDPLYSPKDDCLKCSHKAQLEHEVKKFMLYFAVLGR